MGSFRSPTCFRSILRARRKLAAACLFGVYLCAAPAALGKDKAKPTTVRWDEQHPGCTFSRGDDGKYRYGLWSGDLGITLALDAQELEKVRRRHEPFFGVLLDIRYRGQTSVDLATEDISLQFLKHFKVIQPALDPDGFAEKIQKDADTQDHETAREIEKHPEQKDAKETYTRAFQKDAAELLEFVTKDTLRPSHLDPESRKPADGYYSAPTAGGSAVGKSAKLSCCEFRSREPSSRFPSSFPRKKAN